MVRPRPVYDPSWARSDPLPDKWRPLPARRAPETWAACIERVAKLYQCPHAPALALYQALRREHGFSDEIAARHAMWLHGLIDQEE